MVKIENGVIINFESNCLKSESPCVQRELPGYVQVCPHCGKNVSVETVQQGGMHMDCHGAEVDVWFISLPDAPKHGFCEIEPEQVMFHLEAIEPDEPYLVQKKTMTAGEYYNLPDFEGF